MRRPRSLLPPDYVDAGLALLFTIVGVLEPPMHTVDGFDAGPAWLATVVGVFMGVPLVLRRRAPAVCLSVMCLALGSAGLITAHGAYFWSQLLPLSFAVYPAARLLDGPLGPWGWVLATLAVEADLVHSTVARREAGPWLPLLLFGAVTMAGRLTRRTAGEAARLAETMAQLAEEESASAEAAVTAERSRITVEVHDVVAHAVSVMVLQVGAVQMSLEQRQHPVPDQLRAAGATGREALVELRRSLGLLRQDPEKGPLHPLPGISDVGPLVERFRNAGLDVGLDIEVDTLPAGLELSLYRLLQESLTNALKHAGQVPVRVVVRRQGEDVLMEVTNARGDHRPETLPNGGHGLLGMRERVAMYGGRMEAGPVADGFRVRAVIPAPAAPEVAGAHGVSA